MHKDLGLFLQKKIISEKGLHGDNEYDISIQYL